MTSLAVLTCACASVPEGHLAPTPPLVRGESRHPLDPLSATELARARAILVAEGRLGDGVLVPTLALHEPDKVAVRAWAPGVAPPRAAFAVVLDRAARRTHEAVIDLDAGVIVQWREVPGVQPGVLIDEFATPVEMVRADPRVQAAMKRRGIEDFDNLQVDTWAAGVLSDDEEKTGLRLLRTVFYHRAPGATNPYFRPIEGVIATLDMSNGVVLDVTDTGVVVPVVSEKGDLDPASVGKLRETLAPLSIVQPRGRSFTIDGHAIRWQKWRLRVSLHPREGLVLHEVGYEDEGRVRGVLYRASLSEMLVPYGDPAANWVWRNAFDIGEYGVGRLANTLRPGLELPDNAVTLDADFVDDFAAPYVQPQAIGIYERDGGILWKHLDFETERGETRRSRELVVTFVTTIGNYDYGFAWVFDQAGGLRVEVALTGIMLPKGVASRRIDEPGGRADERFGRLVHAHVVAPNHQHFFNFRLDFDVDGGANALVRLDHEALPLGPDNPLGNAYVLTERRYTHERHAVCSMNMHAQRSWRVISTTTKNSLGGWTGYRLHAGHNAMPYLAPQSPVRRRAGFLEHHIWTTRFHPDELYASGPYPNQRNGPDGLPVFIADDEPVDGQDIVVWYTLGTTHAPRPEEWPVMPAHMTGFSLVPDGFFARNPALDVPP